MRRRGRPPVPHGALGCALLLLAAAVTVSPAGAQELSLEAVVTGLESPVALTHAGDGRLFVVEQAGRIRVVENGVLRSQPFLDVTGRVGFGGERGLFSVAFHPAYAQNGRFFVNYTDNRGDTVIERFDHPTPGSNDASGAPSVVLLEVGQPFGNHNGGQLQFGPDGMLWIGMGDGGSANDPQCNAQRGDTLLGKLLRIDVDRSGPAQHYAIPVDNPFLGSPAMPDEVFALGLRNPWRFSFDRTSGDLFLGDVGQGSREEIDRLAAGSGGGQNFGWKMMEGSLCRNQTSGCPSVPACGSSALTGPILEYDHDEGCSVTGGYVYRGSEIPGLEGAYLYGDFCSGRIWAGRRNGNNWSSTRLGIDLPQLSAFGEDHDGELYLLSHGGTVYRLRGSAPPAEPGVIRFTRTSYTFPEQDDVVRIAVERVDGTAGAVSVSFETGSGSAAPGLDYEAAAGVLEWADGEAGTKRFSVRLFDDALVEPEETVELRLLATTGGAELAEPSLATLHITDDDIELGPCVVDARTHCLQEGRFRVRASWRDQQERRGEATRVELTDETGLFWFFAPDNVELVVKVLDACATFDHFWVFSAGLTNVEVTLTVTDTETGQVKNYVNPLRTTYESVLDTRAFATCP